MGFLLIVFLFFRTNMQEDLGQEYQELWSSSVKSNREHPNHESLFEEQEKDKPPNQDILQKKIGIKEERTELKKVVGFSCREKMKNRRERRFSSMAA